MKRTDKSKSAPVTALLGVACVLLLPVDKTVAQDIPSAESQAERQSAKQVFPPHARPFDKSFAEWSAEWWQFVFSLPASENPILDTVGTACAVGQHGPVWFLVGSFGSTPVLRTCSIPEGEALFFPVVNQADINVAAQTVRELRAEIAPCGDAANALVAEVDGEPIENLQKSRVKSVPFEITVPQDGLLDPGTYSPAVGDGYYVMLKPLSRGNHTIHFSGQEPAGQKCSAVDVDITYVLTVVPVNLGRSH
jgi:hypothetical protein